MFKKDNFYYSHCVAYPVSQEYLAQFRTLWRYYKKTNSPGDLKMVEILGFLIKEGIMTRRRYKEFTFYKNFYKNHQDVIVAALAENNNPEF